MNATHRIFTIEAVKITLFCLIVTGLFKWLGTSDDFLLVIFNMAVMSNAATFSSYRKGWSHLTLGSSVIVLSIIGGGLLGYYLPVFSHISTIAYAGLAFFLSKTKAMRNIFVTGSVVFLIFTFFPFDLDKGLQTLFYGAFVVILFVLFHRLFGWKSEDENQERITDAHLSSLIVVIGLAISWFVTYLLGIYSSLTHLYWIGLTVLVIVQASEQKTIRTSLQRIGVNILGALFIVILFNYLVPRDFWINFFLLVVFLFFIFALGFSYAWRTLFIELFVLGFTHLLGDYQDRIAFDRMLLTFIGGIIVIFTTLISFAFLGRLRTR